MLLSQRSSARLATHSKTPCNHKIIGRAPTEPGPEAGSKSFQKPLSMELSTDSPVACAQASLAYLMAQGMALASTRITGSRSVAAVRSRRVLSCSACSSIACICAPKQRRN